MKKKTIKKVKKPSAWASFPQKTWEQWFSEFVMSQLAVEFYGRTKTWPKKIKLGSLQVIDNPDGSATLKVDLA